MNTKFQYTLIAGLLLGGCNLTDDTTNDMPVDGLEQPSGPLGDPAVELDADNDGATPYAGGAALIPAECVGAPVVGIINDPEGSCDDIELPSEWAWEPMFASGSPDAAGLSLPVPQEFARYCKYEWVGAQPIENVGQYTPLLNLIDAYPYMDLGSVAADCMGFKEQSDLNDPNVSAALQEAFFMNIDALDASDLEHTAMYRQPVRLALLDSVSQWAFETNTAAHNEHGRYMSALISSIACPDGDVDCTQYIRHLLAMPRSDWQTPDWTIGMDYASKVDVAVQVYAAVQQWREAKLLGIGKTSDRLVLNISLGYNRINVGTEEFTRGPQASLKTALDFAACHGALVFAASGNVRDEVCPDNDTGPLAPAAFEALLAPTEAECVQLGFVPDWANDYPVFEPHGLRPLVYAVGAVNAFGDPVVNARLGSLPQLVATGANGLGHDMSMALTGSSVSTAVASATAMLLWSYNPRLRPDEVYAAIYDSGYDIGRPADFGLDGPGRDMHRVSVCAALDSVCQGGDPAECPQFGCVAAAPEKDGNLGGYEYEVKLVLDDPATVIKEHDGVPGNPVCSPAPATELVIPQPELPICGNCKADIAKGLVANDDVLYMSIDASYKGLVNQATLVLEDSVGSVSTVLLNATTIAALNDPSINVVKLKFEGPETTTGTLEFGLVTGESQSNPIIIKHL